MTTQTKSVLIVEINLCIGGVNIDGARGKIGTIKKAVRDIRASLFMMQETKCNVAGKLKLDGFITYEHLRSQGDGGGLALCARKEPNPAFTRDGGEEVEALSIDIHINQMTISRTNAYGPQENASIDKKRAFWNYLSEEASNADKEGKGFYPAGRPQCMAWADNYPW